jgi:hypothetical protein
VQKTFEKVSWVTTTCPKQSQSSRCLPNAIEFGYIAKAGRKEFC